MDSNANPARIAVLIDAENVVASHADVLFAQAEALGEIASKEIYGTAAALTAWVAPVLKYAIHPNLTIRASKGKNSSDIALVIGAMDLLLEGGYDTLVIASSDSDFSALSVRLRNAGINVVGMGTEKSNALWRTACTSFIVLDHPAPAPKSEPAAESVPEPVQPESAPEPAKKPAPSRRQARAAAATHKERVSIIEQFIQKRLDSNGGRLQVGTLFTGLNKLPEYQTDRQGSGRKPLNYLSSTFADTFQFVNSADGKTWVSRVGDEPLPAGAEPLPAGAEPLPAEAEPPREAPDNPAESDEDRVSVETSGEPEAFTEPGAPAEPGTPGESEVPESADLDPRDEEAPVEEDPAASLVRRLTDGGMDPEVAERVASVFGSTSNLRAAYNEIRRIFGSADGRAYYHQAKAILEAEA